MTPIQMPPEWIEYVATERLRKHVTQQQKYAYDSLLAACRETSDPKVAGALSTFLEIESFLKQLGKVNAHGSRDDGDD